VVAWPEPPPPRAKRSPPRHPGLKSSAPRAYSLVQDGATPQRQRILCHTMCGMGIFVIAAGKNQRSTQPSALSVTGKGHKKIQILHRAFLVADHKIATWSSGLCCPAIIFLFENEKMAAVRQSCESKYDDMHKSHQVTTIILIFYYPPTLEHGLI
jgi:hypothetical protein